MKQTIFTIAMIVAVLSLPMEASAKGNSFGKAVLLKDANGVKIGRVIGMEDVSWPYVLTREGYRTLFRIGSGKVTLFPDDGVGFAETNCMGMAYVSRGVSLGAVFLPTPDFHGFYDGGGALLYARSNAVKENFNIKSVRRSNNDCDDLGVLGEDHDLYPAYLNDASVTGIENTVYPNRMLIE